MKAEKTSILDDLLRKLSTTFKKPSSLLQINEDYQGPHINDEKITEEFIRSLIDSYSSANPITLHPKYAKYILKKTIELFEDNVALVELTVPHGGSISIIGDTHGQLIDVLTIFKLKGKFLYLKKEQVKNINAFKGYPANSNVFLFNGDMVDRGPHGVELLLLLFSLKLFNPHSIHFNRGNHESRKMNEKYNFEDQGDYFL